MTTIPTDPSPTPAELASLIADPEFVDELVRDLGGLADGIAQVIAAQQAELTDLRAVVAHMSRTMAASRHALEAAVTAAHTAIGSMSDLDEPAPVLPLTPAAPTVVSDPGPVTVPIPEPPSEPAPEPPAPPAAEGPSGTLHDRLLAYLVDEFDGVWKGSISELADATEAVGGAWDSRRVAISKAVRSGVLEATKEGKAVTWINVAPKHRPRRIPSDLADAEETPTGDPVASPPVTLSTPISRVPFDPDVARARVVEGM